MMSLVTQKHSPVHLLDVLIDKDVEAQPFKKIAGNGVA